MSKFKAVDNQRNEIVNTILAEIEKGSVDWVKTWSFVRQHNPLSGTEYHGINQFNLAAVAAIRGYKDPRWATYNQIKEAGYRLKPKTKATVVEHWRYVVIKDEETDEVKKSFYQLTNYYNVYNFSCIEDMEPYVIEREISNDTLVDELKNSSRCAVREVYSERAYYSIVTDSITIPLRSQFDSAAECVSTLAHEMCHSTMKPLNRNPEPYAFEELVAELGSAFVCSQLGSEINLKNTAAYIDSWHKVIAEKGNDAIFKAASKAQAAADCVLERLK